VQLQALKERAKQHLAAILEQQGTTGSSGNGSSGSSSIGAVDTHELRAKLENAIRVMQTGLVERDTEVSCKQQQQQQHLQQMQQQGL
jgi:hypothetical protein